VRMHSGAEINSARIVTHKELAIKGRKPNLLFHGLHIFENNNSESECFSRIKEDL